MKEISTSISSFPRLIERHCLYVDKTPYIYKMLQVTSGQFFCARPRRFGKSLTVSTLEAIFQGRRELFEGLYLGSTDYDWPVHPVIHIDFARSSMQTLPQLKKWLCLQLSRIGRQYELELTDDDPVLLFDSLICALYDKTETEVVLLIDEYDKPIFEHLDSVEDARSFRDFLCGFFQIIKGDACMLHFTFMTGVTKLDKLSIFGRLNNLDDITMDPDYACMFGYTQQELESYFAEQLNHALAEGTPSSQGTLLDRAGLLAEIKAWYNGFRFAPGANTVYNPYSIGKFFQNQQHFRIYWLPANEPALWLNIIREQKLTLSDLEKPLISDGDLDSFDIARLVEASPANESIMQLMLYIGLLTLDSEKSSGALLIYQLRFPNYEAETSFVENLSQCDRQ